MTRWYARALICFGLAGMLVAGGQIAAISLSHGAPNVAPDVYFACPEGGPAHKRGCPYVDWERTDLISLPGAAGQRKLCEHCATTAQRKAAPRSRSQSRVGTAPLQTRTAGG